MNDVIRVYEAKAIVKNTDKYMNMLTQRSSDLEKLSKGDITNLETIEIAAELVIINKLMETIVEIMEKTTHEMESVVKDYLS